MSYEGDRKSMNGYEMNLKDKSNEQLVSEYNFHKDRKPTRDIQVLMHGVRIRCLKAELAQRGISA